MSAHTPGPWELVETPHEVTVSSWHIHIGEHKLSIFPYKRIYSEDRTQSGLVMDHEHMADAHLIAAAPDLLEALMSAYTLIVRECADGAFTEQAANAYAAIQKAVGAA